MDLSTRYLGLDLPHPLVLGASPLVDELDAVKRAEDAGAAAIVMHSLYEEQLTFEQMATNSHIERHGEAFAEALSYLPDPVEFALGPDEYLEQLRRIRETVDVPIIGSLNGATPRGWLEYATLIEQAGAHALELNVFDVPDDPDDDAAAVESRLIEMVSTVAGEVTVPLAVKLSPFYSSLPNLARRLVEAGASGLVLFNRFYEPDIDLEELEVTSYLTYSAPSELLLRLRWLAVLSARVETSYAVTGGVHRATDALKAVMAGADAVQIVSLVLSKGPEVLSTLRAELADWLEQHEYESLAQAKGSMNLDRCPDPYAYERGNYLRLLQGWRRSRW